MENVHYQRGLVCMQEAELKKLMEALRERDSLSEAFNNMHLQEEKSGLTCTPLERRVLTALRAWCAQSCIEDTPEHLALLQVAAQLVIQDQVTE